MAACSSAPETGLDLGDDQIGCLVQFGDAPAQSVGPVGRTRHLTVDISPDTNVTIANSPTALHIEVQRGVAETRVVVDHADIPSDGYVLSDNWIDAEHPGYEITCVRG